MTHKQNHKIKKASAKKSQDFIIWLRLERSMKVDELKKLGLEGTARFGGDTSIAATSMHPNAGIIVQADLKEISGRADCSCRADPWFGGIPVSSNLIFQN